MPKVSFASKDAVVGGMGVQEGLVEVMTATVKVHQFPPNSKTGEQGAPSPMVCLGLARLDPESGDPMDEDVIDEFFGIGKLEKFHPGNADSADDDDPEDAGDEVDTEGNCIFAVVEGARLNKNSKWIRMITSMEECGFKPEVAANGFMPDLIGMKMRVKTVPIPKFGNSTNENPTALVCDKIEQYPYEKGKKGAKKGVAAVAGKKTPPPSPAGKAAVGAKKGAVAEAENGSGDIAAEILAEIIAANSGKEMEFRKIVNAAQIKLMRNKAIPPKSHKGILEKFKDAEWLGEQAEELESFAVDEDSSSITIA